MKLRMEDGSRYTPKDTDEVKCEAHGLTALWGDLNEIQKMAVAEGLDTTDDLPCIMSQRRS